MSDVSLEKAMKLKAMLKELEQDMKEIDSIAAKVRERRRQKMGLPITQKYNLEAHLPSPQEHVRILEELEVPPLELLEEDHPKKEKQAH